MEILLVLAAVAWLAYACYRSGKRTGRTSADPAGVGAAGSPVRDITPVCHHAHEECATRFPAGPPAGGPARFFV